MTAHTQVTAEHQGPTAHVTFKTSAGVNVASMEFLAELERTIDTLAQQRQVRFVVFQAEGKVFLAGADIKAMKDYSAPQAQEMAQRGQRVFDKLAALPQLTLASIQGACLGGGLELVMACDFRFAVKSVSLGSPEVLLGLIPGWGGTRRLRELVPLGEARRLMFTGEAIKGERAREIGLVDQVVNSAEDLGPLIRAFLDGLAKAGPEAVSAVKRALNGAHEASEFAACFERQEAREGMSAFLERRSAKWNA